MTRVVRLETTVELRPDTGAGRLSVSARHEAVLGGGDRVLLLDDRGWVEEARGAGSGELGPLRETDIAFTARTVVGPDEPWPGPPPQTPSVITGTRSPRRYAATAWQPAAPS